MSLMMMMTYLTNDLVIDEKHEGHHQTNPEHQMGRLQQIFQINCDPHPCYNLLLIVYKCLYFSDFLTIAIVVVSNKNLTSVSLMSSYLGWKHQSSVQLIMPGL